MLLQRDHGVSVSIGIALAHRGTGQGACGACTVWMQLPLLWRDEVKALPSAACSGSITHTALHQHPSLSHTPPYGLTVYVQTVSSAHRFSEQIDKEHEQRLFLEANDKLDRPPSPRAPRPRPPPPAALWPPRPSPFCCIEHQVAASA